MSFRQIPHVDVRCRRPFGGYGAHRDGVVPIANGGVQSFRGGRRLQNGLKKSEIMMVNLAARKQDYYFLVINSRRTRRSGSKRPHPSRSTICSCCRNPTRLKSQTVKKSASFKVPHGPASLPFSAKVFDAEYIAQLLEFFPFSLTSSMELSFQSASVYTGGWEALATFMTATTEDVMTMRFTR
jgi:hypothetical protein